MTACERSGLLFDALLKAAVMDAYAAEIDALPQSVELKANEPSPALDKRIGSLIRSSNRKIKAKSFTKGFAKIAAFNAVLTWREKYTEIQYAYSSDYDSKYIYRPTYLPDGYTEKEFRPGESFTMIAYENEAGDQIIFMQEPAGNGTTAVDNEHTDYSRVTVSGSEGHLFQAREEGNASMLIWEEQGIVFNLVAVLDGEELIRIGDGIK